jgi:hypothetical protein
VYGGSGGVFERDRDGRGERVLAQEALDDRLHRPPRRLGKVRQFWLEAVELLVPVEDPVTVLGHSLIVAGSLPCGIPANPQIPARKG